MKEKIIISFFAVLLFSACSSYKYTSRFAGIQTMNNTLTSPSVVDTRIDFTKKIVVISDNQESETAAKQNAYYKAIKDNSIDVLISPIYVIETDLNKGTGKVKATVSGYAGYFTNARTSAENKKTVYDAKIEALTEMLKLVPIVNEEQKTVILSGNSNEEFNQGATILSTAAPSLIEKFEILYDGYNAPIQQNNVGKSVEPVVANVEIQPKTISTKVDINKVYEFSETSKKDPRYKNWKTAGWWSYFIPGAGQVYNGQAAKGVLMLGIHVAAISMFVSGMNTADNIANHYPYPDPNYTGAYIGLGLWAVNWIWTIADAQYNAKKINIRNGLAMNIKLDKNTDLALQPDFKLENYGGTRSSVVGAKLSLNLY